MALDTDCECTNSALGAIRIEVFEIQKCFFFLK